MCDCVCARACFYFHVIVDVACGVLCDAVRFVCCGLRFVSCGRVFCNNCVYVCVLRL